MNLTIRRIERLKLPGRYADGHGLYLQIAPSGTQSWVFRFERAGRERMMGLGPLHTVDLKEARRRAAVARLQLLDGRDPLDLRKQARATATVEAAKNITFKVAAQTYFSAHEAGWKN